MAMLLAVLLLPMLVATDTFAGGGSYQLPSTCDDHVGLTNRIVGCIRDVLDDATSEFFDSNTGFYPIVSKAVVGALTLAVILFGGLAAFGMVEKVGRDSIMLLLKIAAVGYFVTNSDFSYQQILTMMDKTAEAVVSYVPASGQSDNAGGDFSQITCLKNMHDAQQGMNPQMAISGPWIAMDCMLDSVIGIKVDPTNAIPSGGLTQAKAYNEKLRNGDKGLSRGLLYFFFSSYSSSVMGFMLAAIGLIFLWGIISIIIKSLFIYLAGYIGIAVLIMVSPLFIPLVLFQATRQFFDKWVKLLISFALQPIIILAFVVLTITAVDLATFSGDYSVMYRIAGEASRQNGFGLNDYLTCPRNKNNPSTCLQSIQGVDPNDIVSLIGEKAFDIAKVKADTKDPISIDNTVAGGVVNNLTRSKCTKALMNQDADLKAQCEQSYPLRIWKKNINWELAAQVRNPSVTVEAGVQNAKEQLSKEVLAAVIFAAVVVFVMNNLLKVVPMVAYDLFGDYGQSPNLSSVVSSMPGQQGIREKLQHMGTGRGGGQ